MTIQFDTSHLYPIGTTFKQRGKAGRQAEVIGYHVEYDTDTEKLSIGYRIQSEFMGQVIKSEVPPNTVAMAIGKPYEAA